MDLSTGSIDVLDDLRARHQAVVDLIYFTDTQATTLLQVYVTAGLALATGGLTALYGTGPIPIAAGWGLLIAVAPLLVGCGYCLRATHARALNLPGRGADFWKWAAHPAVDEERVLSAYLESLETKQAANNSLNALTAGALKRAKLAGAVTPAIFVIASVVAYAGLNVASAWGPGSSGCPNPPAAVAGPSVPCLPSSVP